MKKCKRNFRSYDRGLALFGLVLLLIVSVSCQDGFNTDEPLVESSQADFPEAVTPPVSDLPHGVNADTLTNLCGADAVATDQGCVAKTEVVESVSVSTLGLELPGDETVARVDYPAVVVVGLTVDAPEAVAMPVLVALGEEETGLHCTLGTVLVDHPGDGSEVVVKRRIFVPRTCLYESVANPEPVPGLVRTFHVYAQVDPFDAFVQLDDALHETGMFYTEEALAAGLQLAQECVGLEGQPGCVQPVTVMESDGLDIALTRLTPISSIVVHRECLPSAPGEPYRCRTPMGGSEEWDAGDLRFRVAMEAYGVPMADQEGIPQDVLADHDLQLVYAIRALDSDVNWQPLFVRKVGIQPTHQPQWNLGSMTPQQPTLVTHALQFDNGCRDGNCTLDETVLRLIEDGEWKDLDRFEVRACLASEAESTGRNGNNCLTTQMYILREGWTLTGHNASKDGQACPSSANLCFALPGKGGPFGLTKIFGDKSSIALEIFAGHFTRMDLSGAFTKSDAFADLHILDTITLPILDTWAYAGAYTDPNYYKADAGAADIDCSCDAISTTIDHDSQVTKSEHKKKCKTKCGFDPVKVPAECAAKKTDKQKKKCKSQCMTRCMNICEENNRACLDTCSDSECEEGCQDDLDECLGEDEAEAEECDCQAYYNYGIEVLGTWFWGDAKASPLKYTFDYSIVKEKEKRKQKVIYFLIIEFGFKITGQMGVNLELALSSKAGTAEPTLPENRCAVSSKENRCGGSSKDGTCYCDFACNLYGDCCEDFDEICVFGGATLKVVPVKGLCFTSECEKTLDQKNWIGSLTATVTPYGKLDLEAWVALSAVAVQAGVKGLLNILDLKVPFVLAGRYGIEGTPTTIRGITILGEYKGDLIANFLAGSLRFYLEHIDVKYCCKKIAGVKVCVPCGYTYTEFWSKELAAWSGFPWELPIITGYLGDKSWHFDVDYIDCEGDPSCNVNQ